jgi:hypothetical protein
MKYLIYMIIIILVCFITYSLVYSATTKEGLEPTSSYSPTSTIASTLSASQCQAIASTNPKIDDSNYASFLACNTENIINDVGLAQSLLQKLEPSTTAPYLINTFSQDISAVLTLYQQSTLIGQSWNTAANSLSSTSPLVSKLNQDVVYLKYLTSSPPSYPNFSEGTNIPPYIEKIIQSNSCTPLIDPSFNQKQLNNLNQTLQQQQNLLATIENDISGIRQRYPIQFSVGTVSVNSTPGASPSIKVSGQLPSPVLNFTILAPLDGINGITGPQGPQGLPGTPGEPGPQGLAGYWGSMGTLDNVYG